MFDLDTWQEILDTIRSNKLRTVLTGFSVAWGILMLVILLGSGTGLSHGVEYQFRDDAVNSVFVMSGQTSLAHKGLRPGRNVQFRNPDYDEVKDQVQGVEHITARFRIQGDLRATYGRESGTFDARAVHPDYKFLEKTILLRGRFLNPTDQLEHRKVAVIGENIDRQLFKGEESIGKYLKLNGIAFLVVGVFTDEGGEGELHRIYIPISTAQRAFNGADRINAIQFTTGDATLAESERMVADVRERMAKSHDFAPEDPRALFVMNNVENYMRIMGVMTGIRIFVWVIGIGTLLAGVVGVSNILMIAVRERTREIGIRKALGSTPLSIVNLILQEAVLITTVAGYLGLVVGVALLEVFASTVPRADFFREPQVDLKVAISATVLLIFAGAVAGFFPARRAAAIRPIEALREE